MITKWPELQPSPTHRSAASEDCGCLESWCVTGYAETYHDSMASSVAAPLQPRPRPRPPGLDDHDDKTAAAAAAAAGAMPRRGGTSRGTPISLETFQSTTFDVSQFVASLMDDNVKRAKDATGASGGQLSISTWQPRQQLETGTARRSEVENRGRT